MDRIKMSAQSLSGGIGVSVLRNPVVSERFFLLQYAHLSITMHFKQILAPEGRLRELKNAVDHRTLPHAMLFWGPEGTGKLPSALALTQYLLCRDRQPEGSCGQCRSCVKTEKYVHPDVHFVFPIIKTAKQFRSVDFYPEWREAIEQNPYLNVQDWFLAFGEEKKQLNIPSSECHRIIEQLSLRAYEGAHKVLIIWMAEYLGREANKLLKLIEEPQDDTHIILIADNRNAILPTVLSRCQQFYFSPLATSVIAGALESRLGLAPVEARQIAASSHGNWNLAQHIARKADFKPVEWMKGWIKTAWGRKHAEMRAWSAGMAKLGREENKQYLRYTIDVWQKLFWIKWGIDFEADPDEEEMLKWLNTKIEFNELEELVSLCEKNIGLISRNASAAILWMEATIKLRTALATTHGQLKAQS